MTTETIDEEVTKEKAVEIFNSLAHQEKKMMVSIFQDARHKYIMGNQMGTLKGIDFPYFYWHTHKERMFNSKFQEDIANAETKNEFTKFAIYYTGKFIKSMRK